MMPADPVLIVGGTGALGRRVAEWLRARNPGLPLLIAARDQPRARALANELGRAEATAIDLSRADLGLGDRRVALVVPAFKDHAHATYRFAQDRGIPYLALSEAAFEIGPLVAMHIHRPATPLLLIGHVHGGLPAMTALKLSRGFARVDAIRLGAIFDPADPLPPGAEVDMARIMKAGPPPLALVGGRWTWLSAGDAVVIRRGGDERVAAEAAGLTDSIGLWGATGARSVRLDMGEGTTAPGTEGNPGHEVIIEIDGTDADGTARTRRWMLTDPDGNVAFGAKGIALAAERLLGLDGKPPPPAGLYLPETLFDADAVAAQLPALGLRLAEIG